ncbi:MAG: hypothetical protein KGJ62_05395 [Armatimonadetes bacterium]|nr:hypothetical protein [Armatimonadota bacterium]MDE2206643.1 hypothetical protein [Armatimonadota bacterium]
MTDGAAGIKNEEEAFARLAGRTLTSVTFSLDVLELRFHPWTSLSTRVWPEVSVDGKVLTIGLEGYRDELLASIMQVASAATLEPDNAICVVFESGVKLRIPLPPCEAVEDRVTLTEWKCSPVIFN